MRLDIYTKLFKTEKLKVSVSKIINYKSVKTNGPVNLAPVQ